MGASGVDFEIHLSALSWLWAPAAPISKSTVLICLVYVRQRRRILNPSFFMFWATGTIGVDYEIHCYEFLGLGTGGVDFEIQCSELSGVWASAALIFLICSGS